MHICTSYEVFHPLSLASLDESHFQFPLVGAKTSFSPPTMAARRAKHAKNELVQMPGKLLFMNLFSKTSLVDVAMLVYIFSFKIDDQLLSDEW